MRTARANRFALSAAAALLLVATIGVAPARSAEQVLNATANGRAEAAAVFIPFRVNPNFDLYPAYSYSELANSASQSASHGIAAGFYPGFLLDAFMDFYGFKGPGRALLGFAETQWPDPPQKADASTADFGTLCRESGSNPQITQYFPKSMFDGCEQFYAALTGGFGGELPYRISSGHSESAFLSSSGFAEGFKIALPLPEALTIGHAHSTSSTTSKSERASVSEATTVLRNVTFGELHISEIRSTATAIDDERTGPKAARTFEIVGATIAGIPVTIDSESIRPVVDNEQARDALARFAEEGFVVEVIQGRDQTDPDTGEVSSVSGGLSVRMIRAGTPASFQGPSAELCARTSELQATPALKPGSVVTIPYYLSDVPPLNDAYQRAWDENYPLGLVLPRDIEGEEPIPPVIPCAGVLFDRSIDAGVVLGVTSAGARFDAGVPLPDLGDVISPDIPDRVINTTITIPGPGSVSAPPGAAGPGAGPTLVAVSPGLGADVASRIKLIYGAIVLLLASLVAGRSAFRYLVRN
jgi:hypothetical protein